MSTTVEKTSSVAVDALNELLSSEIAACETYALAIRKIEGTSRQGDAVGLRVILDSHRQHVDALRREVTRLGGEPEVSGGAWGLVTKTVESAVLFGDVAAMQALEDGERHSIRLAHGSLPAVQNGSKHLVTQTILPGLERHIELLKAFTERM